MCNAVQLLKWTGGCMQLWCPNGHLSIPPHRRSSLSLTCVMENPSQSNQVSNDPAHFVPHTRARCRWRPSPQISFVGNSLRVFKRLQMRHFRPFMHTSPFWMTSSRNTCTCGRCPFLSAHSTSSRDQCLFPCALHQSPFQISFSSSQFICLRDTACSYMDAIMQQLRFLSNGGMEWNELELSCTHIENPSAKLQWQWKLQTYVLAE